VSHTTHNSVPRPTLLGTVAALGILIFALVCPAAQFLRSDLDWMRVPLSFYLLGPSGWIVKSAYAALSVALIALGTDLYRNLSHSARSAAPLVLFCASGVSLLIVAIADTDLPGEGPTLRGGIHVLAAEATFLCVTVAMLLQSWRFRLDARWRERSTFALVLASVAFVTLWVHAFTHVVPRGLMQKTLIAMILLWLGRAAWSSRKP
jgi:hypothetical protein